MYKRPNLYTSYESESQLLPTWTQKVLMGFFLVQLVLLPFSIPLLNDDIPGLSWLPIIGDGIPLFRFLGDGDWIRNTTTVLMLVIAAHGLNLLSGVAGQVSLGHAFFMGVGACTATYLGSASGSTTWGHSLPIWIWLPGAGVAAAIIGIIVSPVAVKLRGLYLAIVTLGLVFLGIHLGNTEWGAKIAGPPALGRKAPELDIRIWKEETPLINLSDDGRWLWFDISEEGKRYLFYLMLAVGFTLLAKNLIRTRTGRAWQAIRDRDIAAEVMGIAEFRYKVQAFAISSFFAGIAGALFVALSGQTLATDFSLFLSVEFIAILLIGGAGTTSGVVIGTFVVWMMPEFVKKATEWLGDQEGGVTGTVGDAILTEGDDLGVINTSTVTPGWTLSVFDWNIVLFGVLIIVFLIFEPLGMFGIWVKIRNYWKRWPFSY
ncbi:MAG: branched-chain amino acid ABC transporter permease [Actinomycetota bacterium]